MPTLEELLAPLAGRIVPDFVAGPLSGAGVFTGSPDMGYTFRETFSSPTDVIVAYDVTEQRIRKRGQSLRRFEYQLQQVDEIQSAEIMAKLWQWMGKMIAVPAWSDAMILKADVPVGFSHISLAVDTTEPAFAVGGPMMLWSDRWTYEFVGVTGNFLDSATTLAWSAGVAYLVPMIQMVFDGEPPFARVGGRSTLQLKFVSDLTPNAV